jgi:polysaccharide chain length determinant protein (PEP-CTERM system associated)
VEDEVRTQSVFDMARAIWARRKWIALVAFVGPLAVVLSVLAFMPRLYEAKATVLVERQQMPESLVKPTVSSELEMRLHAIHEEVLSRARLEELINGFDLYPGIRKQGGAKEAVERLRQDIKLEKKMERSAAYREPTTVAFTVSYRDENPQKAADVTNALARFYVVSNAKKRERQANATASFLKVELEQTKQTLDQQEKRVGEYKKRNSGALPDQAQMNMLSIERMYSELRMNRDAQARLLDRQEGGPGTGGGIDLPSTTDRAAARVALLRQELAELSTRYTDKYPDVVAKKGEIADLEKQIASAPKRTGAGVVAARPVRSMNDPRMANLKAEEQRLLDQVGMYQKRLEDMPKKEQEFQELARDYETTKELYRSLKQRYEEALLGENMEQQQRGELFRIVEPAAAPDQPSAPRTGRLALLGLMASLGLAAVAVMVAEQVDTSFHSLDDLRSHVAAPVVAMIPRVRTPEDERRDKRHMHRLAAFALLAIVIIVGLSWFVAAGNYDLVAFLARRG